MTIQYPNKLDKSRPIYFAMDHTCGTRTGSSYETPCNCKIRDTIINKLKNNGFNVVRTAIGPNELYQNMKYIADNNITNAILFNLFNGVDPANIREVSYDNSDNNGKKFRNNGNDAVLAWFYDSCDFTRTDGTCYASVRDSETHTGRLYNPLEYCKNNKIYVINQSSNNHKNTDRADYTGDKIADAFMALFNDTSSTVDQQENLNLDMDENKTVRTIVTTKTYTIPHYEKIFQVKTDNNGSFSISPDLPYRGEYKATMRYGGDRTHNGCNESISIYNYDQKAKVFNEQLLQTTIIITYTDGTTSSTETGSIGNATNIKRVIKTETYEGGKVVSTTEKTIDVSTILVEAETNINDINAIPTSTNTSTNGAKSSPFEKAIPMLSNVPDVSSMNHAGKDFALVTTRSYTLNEEQYRAVFKRDSKTLQVKDYKQSKFIAFESTDTETFNVCSREVWNAVEESIYYYMVGHNGCKWPTSVVIDFTNHNTKLYEDTTLKGTVNWKAASCLYHFVSDHQNWQTSCGDTSASVCSQFLHNYISEWKFQNEFGLYVAPDTIKKMFTKYNMNGELTSAGRSTALEWLKAGKPYVWHMYKHYFSMLDITDDNSKILVSNSAYGSNGVHGSGSGNWGLNTGWNSATSTSYGSSSYGQHVKASCNWSISNDEQQQLINFFDSMGGTWIRDNTGKQSETLRRQ